MGKQSPRISEKKENPRRPLDRVLREGGAPQDGPSSDHRFLGQQLDLFSISEEVGVGLVLWHPKGALIRRIIRDFWEREHLRNGYQLVSTPHIARGGLWERSGHLDYYADNMYVFEKEGEPYVVKPMNCPLHVQIYGSRPRSYRELPIRYAEWGTVYRYERSGTLHGLMRVRGFTQDDAHIFCTADQLGQEVSGVLRLVEEVLGAFGFSDYRFKLSTRDPRRPERYMGGTDEWGWAQASLAEALEGRGLRYTEAVGEAAFYGPKIDVDIVDASGRGWQCSTVQFDFNLPKRFDLSYVSPDGTEETPYMIHRVLLGAIERFFGVLIEHYGGDFPVWLAPVQVRVMSISEKHAAYAERVHQRLSSAGIRSELDERPATVGYKIREAETEKVPYMAICGRREAESGTVSLRKHGGEEIGVFPVEELIGLIRGEDLPVRDLC